MELPPDGVEQGHVIGGLSVEIKVEMAGQQLVFEPRVQKVQRNDCQHPEEPEAQGKAIIAPLPHLAVEQVGDNGHEENGVFFGEHADPQGHAAEERRENAPIIAGRQVEAQEQPEDHQVVQQHLALVEDCQRRQAEEEAGHHGRDEAPREATRDLEQQEDTRQVHQQHQYAPGVYGVAKGLELVGKNTHPRGNS